MLGLTLVAEERDAAAFRVSDSERIDVFGPGHGSYDFLARHGTGPVVLLEVDDVRAAAKELRAAGVELVSDVASSANYEWIHFRSPDGDLFELSSRIRPYR